jgi:zeaxanthin glucosyltransferase
MTQLTVISSKKERVVIYVMKIGFLSLYGFGHFNPMSAVARQLQSRHHKVVMISLPFMEPLARAADLPFISFGETEFTDEVNAEILGTLGRLKGKDAREFAVSAIARSAIVRWRELPELLIVNDVDALVLDNYDFYAEVLPMYLGMPYATLSNALHFDYSGNTPLCVYGSRHEHTPEARQRSRQGVSEFTQVLIRSNAELIAEVEKVGIKPNWEDPSSLFSDLPWITQCPREFDFESSHWPKQFRYAGPFHDGKGRLEANFPWDRLTGEPIVYVSMGTAQYDDADLFSTMAMAVGKNDAQPVIAIGDLLRPEQIAPVPNNAIVVNHAPQLELLKTASVCVTHAGFNTVLEALTQGVPQVAIPVTHDQPGVAARIAAHQTGVVTALDKLTVSHLATLVNKVLNNPIYRGNACKFQQTIAKTNGLSRAADLLEEAFGLKKKVSESGLNE